jgi:hypothetical protein
MVIGPERDCGLSPSTTLRQPIASSIDIVERSSRDSIERVICLYFSGMHRKSFLMALSSPQELSLNCTIFCYRVLRRRAKSSTSSPGLKVRFSHSLRSACSMVLRARSLPMHATAMASQTSLAVRFLESENYISDRTTAMRASSTRRSS